jgi:K+/H+ antiporter YhaU regulatory subunit KhtT
VSSFPRCELCGSELAHHMILGQEPWFCARCAPIEDFEIIGRDPPPPPAPLSHTEFFDKLILLRDDARELAQRLSSEVESNGDIGTVLGLLVAINRIIDTAEQVTPTLAGHWKNITPCTECGGRVQHRLGCSRD